MGNRLLFGGGVVLLLVGAVLLPAVLADPSAGSAPGDSEETLREQALALHPPPTGTALWKSGAPTRTAETTDYPLFIGVDGNTEAARLVDPLTGDNTPAFTGYAVWGAAYDRVNEVVYFNFSQTLYRWSEAGGVVELGDITDGAATNLNMVGLAFHDGVLYGTRNISNEAVYAIDTGTLVATVLIDYAETFDFGGFAADPDTGEFYGLNDSDAGDGRGLYRINGDASATLIAAYPDGQTDLDGLTIGTDGHAYLIPDEPGSIYVYDFDAGEYLTPIPNPWTTSSVFSAGAWLGFEPMPQYLVKGKLACSFAKPMADSLSISGLLPADDLPVLSDGLGGKFSIGGHEQLFTMTAKGKSEKDASVKVAMKVSKGAFSLSLKKADLAADLGIADEEVPKPGTLRSFAWRIDLDNGWSLEGIARFLWTAKAGKGGKGVLAP